MDRLARITHSSFKEETTMATETPIAPDDATAAASSTPTNKTPSSSAPEGTGAKRAEAQARPKGAKRAPTKSKDKQASKRKANAKAANPGKRKDDPIRGELKGKTLVNYNKVLDALPKLAAEALNANQIAAKIKAWPIPTKRYLETAVARGEAVKLKDPPGRVGYHRPKPMA